MRIHHIGLLSNDLDRSLADFEKMGFKSLKRIVDEKREVKIALVSDGKAVIEIVTPSNPSSKMNNLVRKCGPGIYHICYEVENIEETVKNFQSMGYILVDPLLPAVLFDGKPVAFVYGKGLGLVELKER